MAGSFTLSGLAAGLESGQKTIGPNTITGGAIIGQITDATLVSGDNTFSVPTSAIAVAIFIPASNTAALNLRTSGNLFDTGIPVNPTGPWMVLPLVAGTSSIVLHASTAGATVELTFI